MGRATTAVGVNITAHPFGDEWLWDDTGREPMQWASVEDAGAYANDYRRDMRKGAADGTPAGEAMAALHEAMWFSLEDPEVGLVGLVSPGGDIIAGAEALSVWERIGSDGEWPDLSKPPEPSPQEVTVRLKLVAVDKGEAVERAGALLNEATPLLASHGIDAEVVDG